MFGPKLMIVLVLVAMAVAFGYVVVTSQQAAEAGDAMKAEGDAPHRARMVNEAVQETEKLLGD